MPGPAPKHPDRRQRRNRRPTFAVTTPVVSISSRAPIPKAPAGLLEETAEKWERFWRSPSGRQIDRGRDLEVVERLYTLMDERERALRIYRKQRLLEGSQGQKVMNPMGRQLPALDAEIRQIRAELGFSLRAVAAAAAAAGPTGADTTVEALNEAANDSKDDGPDPRLTARR